MLTASFLDYLDVLIWPLVVVLILAAFVRRYGDHIGPLIDRISSVKLPLGAGVAFAEQQEQVVVEHVEIDAEPPPANLVNDVVDLYEARVAELHAEHQEQVEYLARELAVRDLWIDFERTYRVIYGSQIAALRTMRATPGGAQRAAVEAHLESVKRTFTAFPWMQAQTFEAWFGFLARSELAESGPLYRITLKGEAFLSYIEALALPPRFF